MNHDQIISEFQASMKADSQAIQDKLATFSDTLLEVQRKQGEMGEPGTYSHRSTTLGDQAVDAFSKNAETFHKSGRLRLELKAAGDSVTTASGRMVQTVGVGSPSAMTMGLQNAFQSRGLFGTTAVEYSRYTGLEGAAGVQAAEGDLKAKVRPSHSIINQTALTIAATTTMSRQALNDSVELRLAVEVTLARATAATLDDALYNGTAAPLWSGFDDLATTLSSSFVTLADAVSDAVGVMQLGGFMPDVVAVSPATWVQIMTLRADAGEGVYLSGNYLGMTEPVLRGLRVVVSNSVPLGKALVIDSSHSELIVVQNPVVEIGTIDDQFSRNLATLLLEFRIAPVFRTVGSAILVSSHTGSPA